MPVTNVSAAASFYLSSLQPLGYRYISQVQHNLSNGKSSTSVGLGPEHTNRVDLFLSQSGGRGFQSSSTHPAHVVFPASSQLAVRKCYSAALAAGGTPVMPPSTQQGGEGMFAAVVSDADGNKVEVCYGDSVPQGTAQPNGDSVSARGDSPAGSTIQQWRETVADSHGRTTKAPPSAAKFAQTQTTPPAASAAPSGHSSTRRSSHSTTKPPSASGSTKSRTANNLMSKVEAPGGNKTVVGTIIGAAAGAALAYTMSRSKQDSARREDEYHTRLDTRDRLKAEAREHSALLEANGDNSPWRSKARSSTHRNNYIADRDSGYYSNASHRDNSPVDGALIRRGFTFPEAGKYGDMSIQGRRSVSTHPNDRPGSATTRRLIEYPDRHSPSPRSVSTRPANYRRGSYSDSGRSHSTIKPAKPFPPPPASSYSTRSARYTAHSIAPPSPPPPVPLLTAESSHSRRGSHSSSRRASHDQSYNAASPENQPPPRSTASRRSGPPPSSYTIKNSESYHTARTTNTRARATSSPQQYKRSTTVYPATPPPAPPSALTARALSTHSAEAHAPRTDSRFDDLESLCPDDSISNVPEPEVRLPARSRSVRDSYAGRMANHGSYAARMMGERGHGPGRRSGVAAG